MSDLFGREKAALLLRALASDGGPRHAYTVGDIIYWSPGPDVAVYYRAGGPTIPDPGVVLLARLASGARAFNVPGTVPHQIWPERDPQTFCFPDDSGSGGHKWAQQVAAENGKTTEQGGAQFTLKEFRSNE
jgi:hypothetical protein